MTGHKNERAFNKKFIEFVLLQWYCAPEVTRYHRTELQHISQYKPNNLYLISY